MSLYPSLEDMKVDNMVQAQLAQYPPPNSNYYPSAPNSTGTISGGNRTMYPALGDYMGLELSQDVIALNMPEYQIQQVNIKFRFMGVGLLNISL